MCENMDNTHARRFDDTGRRRAGERGAIMTLCDCPRAMRVVVDGIDLDDRHRFRLCEIGLAPGAGLRVMQRSAFGGRVVAFGNERVAVDGGTARRTSSRGRRGARGRTKASASASNHSPIASVESSLML